MSLKREIFLWKTSVDGVSRRLVCQFSSLRVDDDWLHEAEDEPAAFFHTNDGVALWSLAGKQASGLNWNIQPADSDRCQCQLDICPIMLNFRNAGRFDAPG